MISAAFAAADTKSAAVAARSSFMTTSLGWREPLARLHSVFLDHWLCDRASEEFDQRLGGDGFAGTAVHACGECGDLLHLGRQRTDVGDAREMDQFADLLKSDIGFLVREQRADGDARRRLLEPRLDVLDRKSTRLNSSH